MTLINIAVKRPVKLFEGLLNAVVYRHCILFYEFWYVYLHLFLKTEGITLNGNRIASALEDSDSAASGEESFHRVSTVIRD
jgi:hypothetical protein